MAGGGGRCLGKEAGREESLLFTIDILNFVAWAYIAYSVKSINLLSLYQYSL